MSDTTIPIASPDAPLPWWVKPLFAYTILVAFIALGALIIYRSDEKYEQMVLTALIALTTGGMGYYFGSSAGSDKKDATNAGMAQALATSTPATTSTANDDVAAQLAAKLPTPPAGGAS